MNLIAIGIGWAALVALAPLAARLLCRWLGLEKPNFQNRRIPASVGIAFLLVAIGTYGGLARSRPLFEAKVATFSPGLAAPKTVEILKPPPLVDRAPLFLIVAVGFGLLGLIDDKFGSRAVGGFRGHLRAKRITTGLLKLVGGGLIALYVAWTLRGATPWLLVDALLIALAANAINLLDLRPGRALFGFALLTLPTLVLVLVRQSLEGGILAGAVACSAATEWRADAGGQAMMGDTGSNLLGSVAGLAAAIEMPNEAKVVVVVLLLALNIAAERVSISAVIARTPWLAALDRGLGVRESKSA